MKVNIKSQYTHTYVCVSGVRNVRFSENLACFVFLKHPFWNSLFYRITDEKSETLFFFVCSGGGLPKQYWNSDADHLLLPDIKTFYETKIALELVSLPHFLHDFSRKKFLTLNSHNCTNFTHWLSLLPEILGAGNMCIVIICFPVYGVKNFEILAFFSQRFPTWPEKSRQKFKYLKNEKGFYDEIKNILITFKGHSLKQIKPTFLQDDWVRLNTSRLKH